MEAERRITRPRLCHDARSRGRAGGRISLGGVGLLGGPLRREQPERGAGGKAAGTVAA